MNLSDAKSFDTDAFEYDTAHRELSAAEQAEPCTCQRNARRLQSGASFPSLITRDAADPDCELHFPWMIEDRAARIAAMRTWMAGYQVGYATAMTTLADLLSAPIVETLDGLAGWALDESHANPDPDWLESISGVGVAEVESAVEALREVRAMRAQQAEPCEHCGYPVVWVEKIGDYRHTDPNRTCWLHPKPMRDEQAEPCEHEVPVVFDLESESHPRPLGTYVRTDESVVVYTDSHGRIRQAPEDCVAVAVCVVKVQ